MDAAHDAGRGGTTGVGGDQGGDIQRFGVRVECGCVRYHGGENVVVEELHHAEPAGAETEELYVQERDDGCAQ